MICDRPCVYRAILDGELACLRNLQPDSEDHCRGFKTPAEAAEEEQAFDANQLKIKCKNCN